MAKAASRSGSDSKSGPKASSSAKRELIKPKGDARYIRRDERGRIAESDDVGRSLAQDRKRRAKTASPPGQGDKGDRKPSAGGRAPKKK